MTPRLRLSDPLLRVQSDERLAALAGAGGERAFAILVERHRVALLAFARRLGAGAGAEDVVQQTLLQAWSALQRGARVEHVSAWMHQIVRNAAIRTAAASLDSAELPATLVAPSRTADEVELRHETRRLLAEIERLPVRQREALVRLAVVGSSGDEAGAAMDLEANAVRQLAFRARTQLRAAMGACVPWPLALWAARGGAIAGGVPELVGGAGGAGAAAGLLKVGAIATTTVAVAVGAGGIVRAHHLRAVGAVGLHVATAAPATGNASAAVAGSGPSITVPISSGAHAGRSRGEHRFDRSGSDSSGSSHRGSSPGSGTVGEPSSGPDGSDRSGGRHDGRDDSAAHEHGGGRGDRVPASRSTETEHGGSSAPSHDGDDSPSPSGDDGGAGGGGNGSGSSDGGSGSSGRGSSGTAPLDGGGDAPAADGGSRGDG
ncbi:MAG TPA: sigma-70 family RNA polymerase sigma factor [Conexibacter sp.]|nr:sigma-70 family RNA polymerase sigma factor [Conexibacter sp.]